MIMPIGNEIIFLVWGLAGLAAGFVLPRVRPHLLYLAAYLLLCTAVVSTVYFQYMRGILQISTLRGTIDGLLLLLPWAGIGLAVWWRSHPSPPPGADPLWKRLALFGGLALGFVAFLVINQVVFFWVLYQMDVPLPSILSNMLRFHLLPWLAVGLASALLVPRLRPARWGIVGCVVGVLGLFAYQLSLYLYPPLFRMTLPFSTFYNNYYFFLPYLVLLLALLLHFLRRKPTQA